MKSILFACLLLSAQRAFPLDDTSSTFTSLYADQDVRLHADPRSKFWKAATPVYAERDNFGALIPRHRTEIRSRWTVKNLYLLFVCPYEDLYLHPAPDTKTETNELWNWDVAELFIGPTSGKVRQYKEFEVSPQGEWVDLNIDLDLPDHTVGWTWNSGFEVDAHVDQTKKVWYAAMRIPLDKIDAAPPQPGRRYRANLYRSQGPPDKRKSIAWRPTMRDTFHNPESFGSLLLVSGSR